MILKEYNIFIDEKRFYHMVNPTKLRIHAVFCCARILCNMNNISIQPPQLEDAVGNNSFHKK
jgi:hypothetical protein